MKISARNMLKGKVVEVTKGATTAHVRIDVGGTIRARIGAQGHLDVAMVDGRPDADL